MNTTSSRRNTIPTPGFERPKERERYYLFAGMGGRAARRKNKIILKWSIVAGILVSALLAGFLYLINRR